MSCPSALLVYGHRISKQKIHSSSGSNLAPEVIRIHCCICRFMFGHQRHHHPLSIYGSPGGSEYYTVLCGVPAAQKRCSTSRQMDLPTCWGRASWGWAPHRSGQHAEGPFLWQLHQKFFLAQDEADSGEAREDFWLAHPECIRRW